MALRSEVVWLISWAWAFGVTALVFNPLVPLHMDRSTWAFVDVAAALLMLVSLTNRELTPKSGPPRDDTGR